MFSPNLARGTHLPVMRVPWVQISHRLHVCSNRCLARAIKGLGRTRHKDQVIRPEHEPAVATPEADEDEQDDGAA